MDNINGDHAWNPVKAYQLCVPAFGLFTAAVIVVVVFLCIFATESGINGYEWVAIVGGVICIFWGYVLTICCREGANRLAWRKRLMLYDILDKFEHTNLAGTELGIRPGKEAAWIEYGHKSKLGRILSDLRPFPSSSH